MVLINAENLVLGRLASYAAKKALEGQTVTIVNAEKAIITGSRESAASKLKTRLSLHSKGNPEKGPKFSRMPDRVLRMAIRGMLPWKKSRGKQAYRRVKAYIGFPQEFQGKEFEKIQGISKEAKRFASLGEVCRLLGAKW